MIVVDESPARDTHTATTKLITCPDCHGSGEIEFNVTRSEWGVWEADTADCRTCDGTGEVELVRCQAAECETWFDPREQLCGHGEPVCDSHRGDCAECMLDARDAS